MNIHDPANIVELEDVKKGAREGIQNRVNGKYGNKDCKAHVDYREILTRDDQVVDSAFVIWR